MAKRKDVSSIAVIRGKSDPSLKADIENEKVEAMGQESDTKAVKWVQEENKETEKQQMDAHAIGRQILEDTKKREFEYKIALLKELLRQQQEYDIPLGFTWGAKLDPKGIAMWLKSPDGNMAAVGMKPSGDPMYDMNWIDRRLNDAIGLMERVNQHTETHIPLKDTEVKTDAGIILPKK